MSGSPSIRSLKQPAGQQFADDQQVTGSTEQPQAITDYENRVVEELRKVAAQTVRQTPW